MTVVSNTSKAGRYLVLSADERTWKFNRPILFLGEWCRLPERDHVWEYMDAIVAELYGMGKADKDLDKAEALFLEDKLLNLLCEFLNPHHRKEYSKSF